VNKGEQVRCVPEARRVAWRSDVKGANRGVEFEQAPKLRDACAVRGNEHVSRKGGDWEQELSNKGSLPAGKSGEIVRQAAECVNHCKRPTGTSDWNMLGSKEGNMGDGRRAMRMGANCDDTAEVWSRSRHRMRSAR